MMVFTIAGKELRSLFVSPLAWAMLAVVQAVLAYFFLLYLEYFIQIQSQLTTIPEAPGLSNMVISPLFATVALILLLIVPLVTMRLVSEERRTQTISLLLSAPVSISEIIIGKFLGVMGFLLIMLCMILLMPLSLIIGGVLDLGALFSGVIALLLLLSSFTAIGLFMSTLTQQPTVAAVSTFGVLLILWIMDLATSTGDKNEILAYLSMLNHYQSMLQGMFNSADAIYYLLITAVFIILSIRKLDTERLQH